MGPLPRGQITRVSAAAGTLIAVALPGQSPSTGLVWRLARRVNANLIRQTSEANVGRDVVVVYKTLRPGSVTIAYGLTKGDTRKAYKSLTYKIEIH